MNSSMNNSFLGTSGSYAPAFVSHAQCAPSDGNSTWFSTVNESNFPHADSKLRNPADGLTTLEAFQGADERGRGLTSRIIRHLLRPGAWKASDHSWTVSSESRPFFLQASEFKLLIALAEDVLRAEPTLLQLQAPIKVFGDLHGQFEDLLRLFREYGMPTLAGDLALTDYLFLGDYVDRGAHSLEIMVLLLALKIQRPGQIFLLRGNHECSAINKVYGLYEECLHRLGQVDGDEIYNRLNRLFTYLPLAAVINQKILAMHGGIGDSVDTLESIAQLTRPIDGNVFNNEPHTRLVNSILWSDPTSNDSVIGIQVNARGPNTVMFGPDAVHAFCARNRIDLILRAHQCVPDGFERFANGRLVTIFSATNYCGTSGNSGAILQIGRNLEVLVKMIQPSPSDSMSWNDAVTEQFPASPMNSPRQVGRFMIQEEEEEEEEMGDKTVAFELDPLNQTCHLNSLNDALLALKSGMSAQQAVLKQSIQQQPRKSISPVRSTPVNIFRAVVNNNNPSTPNRPQIATPRAVNGGSSGAFVPPTRKLSPQRR